jgi:hypothetical protein
MESLERVLSLQKTQRNSIGLCQFAVKGAKAVATHPLVVMVGLEPPSPAVRIIEIAHIFGAKLAQDGRGKPDHDGV